MLPFSHSGFPVFALSLPICPPSLVLRHEEGRYRETVGHQQRQKEARNGDEKGLFTGLPEGEAEERVEEEEERWAFGMTMPRTDFLCCLVVSDLG